MKTLQEIFDTGVLGIRWQGGLAKNFENNFCYYRQWDGPTCRGACAIGWNISDEDYAANEIEGHAVFDTRRPTARLAGIGLDDMHFAQRFQSTHDDAQSLGEFLSSCQSLALEFNLNPDCITREL